MEAQTTAWLILGLGFALPLLHVCLARNGGAWLPPPGSRCPLGPRVGWIVMVLLLGPVGWLLFALSRRRAGKSVQAQPPEAPRGQRLNKASTPDL